MIRMIAKLVIILAPDNRKLCVSAHKIDCVDIQEKGMLSHNNGNTTKHHKYLQ